MILCPSFCFKIYQKENSFGAQGPRRWADCISVKFLGTDVAGSSHFENYCSKSLSPPLFICTFTSVLYVGIKLCLEGINPLKVIGDCFTVRDFPK